jgi:hypothetical protein
MIKGRRRPPVAEEVEWWRKRLVISLILALAGCGTVSPPHPPPPYLCVRAITDDGAPVLYCEPLPKKATP